MYFVMIGDTPKRTTIGDALLPLNQFVMHGLQLVKIVTPWRNTFECTCCPSRDYGVHFLPRSLFDARPFDYTHCVYQGWRLPVSYEPLERREQQYQRNLSYLVTALQGPDADAARLILASSLLVPPTIEDDQDEEVRHEEDRDEVALFLLAGQGQGRFGDAIEYCCRCAQLFDIPVFRVRSYQKTFDCSQIERLINRRRP